MGADKMEKNLKKIIIFKQKELLKVLFWSGLFTFLYIFFTKIHPLVIYDSDDWSNISYIRQAFPLWNDWNPSRVFPETFMPLISYAAVYLVKPFVHDYIMSMTITHGFIISITILIYLSMFCKWIKTKFKATEAQAIIMTGAFILFHFSILKVEWNNNSYLFYSNNVTCYFYYLLPNLINAIIVMLFMSHKKEINENWDDKLLNKGLLILLVYLAILSNLFQTIILISYMGYNLLVALITYNKQKKKNKIIFLKQNILSIATIALWLISLVFEFGGERSANIASNSIQIKKSFSALIGYLPRLNKMTTLLFLVSIIIAIIIWVRSRNIEEMDKSYINTVIESLICVVIVTIFLVLLCGVSGSGYLERVDVSFGIFFYGFLFVVNSMLYVLQKYPRLTLTVPLIMYIVLMNSLIGERIYKESNMGSLDPKICIAVNRDLINQIVKADQNGETDMVLHVPVGNEKTDDNWPHADYMGYSISRTLYRHGMISKLMTIKVEPDIEMNKRYHVIY
jgi:hypothetical protein